MIENHVSISTGGNTSLRKSRSSWSAFERKIFCLAEGRQKYGRQDAKFFGVKNRAQVIAHQRGTAGNMYGKRVNLLRRSFGV
jgi:hypothetical protein